MARSAPNLRHLRALSEVAALQSISAATSRVHLSQSALTQAISKMENQLGCPLFHRYPQGLYLTHEGSQFLQRINRALLFLQQGVRDALRLSNPLNLNGHPSEHPAQLVTHAQLRALLAIQTRGSFSGAARATGISQPAIHRSARDLEQALNVQLFERGNNGLDLTRSAHRLARYGRLALREVELGYDELSHRSGLDTTTLRIGCRPLARAYLLPAAINRVSALRPGLNIHILEGSYALQMEQLQRGELDLVLGTLPEQFDHQYFVHEKLLTTPMSVVARPGHPLAGESGISLTTLAGYPWVLPRSANPIRFLHDRLFEGYAQSRRGGLVECSSQVVLREILAGSDRLALVPAHQVRREVEIGVLTLLDAALPPMSQPVGITTRREWHPTSSHQLLTSILRQLAKSLALDDTATLL